MDVSQPVPGAGEVRVRVHASAVNPADVTVVRWGGPARLLHAKVTPLVPGYDLSGVVDALGSEVRDLAVGDAVFGHLAYSPRTRQGAFEELVTIDARRVAMKPEGVDHATAAASATVGLTALQALRKAELVENTRLLVIGASGGVGSLAVGIGKRLGAHVTAVCSTYAVEFVRSLGADAVVDRKAADPLAHEQPFDVIFDTTGRYSYRAASRILTGAGVFVTTLPSLSFALGKISTFMSARRCVLVAVESRREDLEQLGRWLAEGMPVPVAERVPVRDAVAAFEHYEAGGTLGKIAVDVLGGF